MANANDNWMKYVRGIAQVDENATPAEQMMQRVRESIPVYQQARLTDIDKTVLKPSDSYLGAVGLTQQNVGAKPITLSDITPQQFGQMSRNIPRSTMYNPIKAAQAATSSLYGFPAELKQDQWYQYTQNQAQGQIIPGADGEPDFRAVNPLNVATQSMMQGQPVRSPINPGLESVAAKRAIGAYNTPEYQQVLRDEAQARYDQWNAEREAWLERMPQFVSETKDASKDQRLIARDYYAWAQEGKDKGYADDEFYIRHGMGDLVSDDWLKSYDAQLGAGITALEGKDWTGYDEQYASDLEGLEDGTLGPRSEKDWKWQYSAFEREYSKSMEDGTVTPEAAERLV